MSALPIPDVTIERFEACLVDAAHFDHAAHVYVGWLYLLAYPLGEAINRFDRALGQLVQKLGVPDKYHATITWTFLLLIKERIQEKESWQAFRIRNQDLLRDSKVLLARYFSEELLRSERARKHFVLPDRLAD